MANYRVSSPSPTTDRISTVYIVRGFARVSPTAGLLLAVGIYVAQVGLSNLWFRRFRYGSVEWLWRSLTYGRWIT